MCAIVNQSTDKEGGRGKYYVLALEGVVEEHWLSDEVGEGWRHQHRCDRAEGCITQSGLLWLRTWECTYTPEFLTWQRGCVPVKMMCGVPCAARPHLKEGTLRFCAPVQMMSSRLEHLKAKHFKASMAGKAQQNALHGRDVLYGRVAHDSL